MYNLIVKGRGWRGGRDEMLAERVFEHTDAQLVARYKPNNQLDNDQLLALPTVFAEEGRDNQIARVGNITRLRDDGRNLVLDYTYDLQIPPIMNRHLVEMAVDLDIRAPEFTRNHWSVKDVDLFRVLMVQLQPRRPRPQVFDLAEYENIEPTLISAMMPFAPEFDAVYQTLRDLAQEVGLRCRRADDIWEAPNVMQDVVNLIDRSRIVIAACSGRNTNVFYEIGIAHTLGRDVILITQSGDDIPFDLRHLRYIPYLNNQEGRTDLARTLRERLADAAV
ncbi:MAG: hypothetical protein KJ587_00085 [Alphaproteobacteria bacterium]|nr:hypothetical protein [Alphaproteobacteria bacterium]